MRYRRAATLLAAAALVLAGCDQVTGDVTEPLEDVASGLRSAAEDVASEAQPDGGEGGGAPGAGQGSGAEGTDGPASGEDRGGDAAGAQVEVDDLGQVGANGPAMLRDSYPTLVLEVDVQEGADLDPSAVDHLLEVLGAVTDKPNGIVQAGGNRFASDRTTWTAGDLRAVAEEHRSNLSDAETVVVYVLYVRGRSQNEDAIGVAHNASEFAVFPERWRGTLSQTLGSATAVERAVLVHELGHLFGLVNLTYDSRFDREDPDHPGHSSERDSVMHWAIETTAIGQVFNGPPPDDFNEADRADLRYLRTGSY